MLLSENITKLVNAKLLQKAIAENGYFFKYPVNNGVLKVKICKGFVCFITKKKSIFSNELGTL